MGAKPWHMGRLVHGNRRGERSTPEYLAWTAMMTRCYNPRQPGYKNYGGRGITVDPDWRVSFLQFFFHVGPKPSPQHTLDRINNDGNYEPGNVRWVTRYEQARNRRSTKLTQVQVDQIRALHKTGWNGPMLARLCGVSRGYIYQLVKGKKWPNIQPEQPALPGVEE